MTECAVNKIDSNVTGLSFAEEACLKILPSVIAGDLHDPIWYGLEPNSYSDLGGALTTVARQPISASRQRKKGTVTDLTAAAGFNTDLTQNNLTRLLQGFFFNDASEKPTTQPLNAAAIAISSIANADNSFNAFSGLGVFLPGHIVKASGVLNANSGRHVVSSATGAKVVVAEVLTDETPTAKAKLEVVGYRFAAGAVTLAASASAAVLTIGTLSAATGTLTISSTNNAVAAETVTIGGKVYTWRATVATTANEVLIGANKTASMVNLAAAINGSTGAGTLYGSATVAHTAVSATSGAGTLVVTAKASGTAGNAIGTTQTMSNGTWGAATLAGGTGAVGFLGLGLQVGEWVFLGGDDVSNFYTATASTNRPGYARIGAITDKVLTFDDTTFDPQTDAGAGVLLEMYFGTVIKNGAKLRSYQFERTLGEDSVGPQAQYVTGAVANELTFNMPSADKLNVDLTFAALNEETRNGTEGLKTGARVDALGEAAFNSSLDMYRVRMAIIDPANMNSDDLFAFVQDAKLTIKNNASPVKALGNVGGFDVSVGNFDAGGSITAYFATVAAIEAIRANADVAFNVIVAAGNAGFVFDMPLLGVGGGKLAVALNSPVTIPIDQNGAENINGYTLLADFFSYLPTVAMPA